MRAPMRSTGIIGAKFVESVAVGSSASLRMCGSQLGQSFTHKPICIQTHARIIKKWMRLLSVEDVSLYSTHSLRKTKATILYSKTGNLEAIRLLLGHKSLMDTSRYLGVEDADATELARNIKV